MKKIIVTLVTLLALAMSFLPGDMALRAYADEDASQEDAAGDGSVFDDIADELDPNEDPFDFIDDDGMYSLLEESDNYPDSFDLRDVNGVNYVTPVRSQAPYGTCWGFAAIAAAESSILGSGLEGAYNVNTLNLSEKQLAFFSAKALDDPSNSQNGEGQYVEDFITIFSLMNRGGNVCIAASVMAQGIGPQHEDYDRVLGYHGTGEIIDSRYINGVFQPYCYSEFDDWSIPESYRFTNAYTLKEARILPAPAGRDEKGLYEYNPAGTAAIKQELLKKRAVMASFLADTSLPGQDSSSDSISPEWAHYTCMPTGTNHMVTIVGWDDNYSRDNFLTGTVEAIGPDGDLMSFDKTPPYDGAWLVKNSWGSGECAFPDMGMANWGIENEDGVHTGYFWLSYYDQSLLSAGTLIFEEPVPYDEITDQYDYMPMGSAISYYSDEDLKMANIFWADSNQTIEYVTSFTTAPDTDVTYEIYILDDHANNPTDGIKVAETSYHYAYGGYHKESIDDFNILFDTTGTGRYEDVLIMKDQSYSVIVTQTGADGQGCVNFQFGQMEEGGGITNFKGIINPGESWIYKDDSWNDYAYADDLREEIADSILGNDPFYEYSKVSFDNFPIKTFCRAASDDLSIVVTPGDVVIAKDTRIESSAVRCSLYGPGLPAGGIADEDITWQIVDDADEPYVEILDGSDPTRKTLKALRLADDPLWFHGCVTIKNVGTAVFKVGVTENILKEFFLDEDSSLIEDEPVYVYTGEELKPVLGVDISIPPAEEGKDYKLEYKDNVECGIAACTAVGLGGMFKEEPLLTRAFAIVPGAPGIELTEGEGSLSVKITSEIVRGTEGFHIWYRAEGTEEWQEMDLTGGDTAVINNLEKGKKYEVQAAGFITNEPDETTLPLFSDVYYGVKSAVALSGEIGGEEASSVDETVSYSLTSGNGSEWTKGSKDPAAFTFKRSVSDGEAIKHFKELLIDDKTVDKGNYTAESGSVVIKLKPEFLEKLSEGEHKITAAFDDADSVSGKFKVKAAEKPTEGNKDNGNYTPSGGNNSGGKNNSGNNNSQGGNNSGGKNSNNPKTGDVNDAGLWMAILLAAGLSAVFLILLVRKTMKD